MSYRRWLLVGTAVWAVVGLLALPGITAAAVSTDFESVPIGTAANDIAIPGVDFAPGAASPSAFTVQHNAGAYASLSGHILTNAGGNCMTSISMRFSALQAGISFLYGADRSLDPTVPDAVLYLYTGGDPTPGIGTRVHTGSYYGSVSSTGKWEGTVSVTVNFDYVVLFSPSGCLAIDNLNTVGISVRSGPGPDMIPLPPHAAVGTLIHPTEAWWAPMENASTGIMLPAGMSLWVLGQDESGEYYEVALSGVIIWVKVEDMGPNYDDTWGGHPLPTAVN